MLAELRKAIGVPTLIDALHHVERFEQLLRRHANLHGSALIFGPYKDCTWGAYWLDSACVEQFLPCRLEDWIDTPSHIIARVRTLNAGGQPAIAGASN